MIPRRARREVAEAARMSAFRVGDRVRPKPEWVGDPNNVPSGVIRAVERWGKDGALFVGDERRAFAADVFELEPRR